MYGTVHIKQCVNIPEVTILNPNYKAPKNPVYRHIPRPSHNPRYSECNCYNEECYSEDFKRSNVVGVYVAVERREYGIRTEIFHRPIIIVAEEYTPVNCFSCGTEVHKGHSFKYKVHDNGLQWASIFDKDTVPLCFDCHFRITIRKQQCGGDNFF